MFLLSGMAPFQRPSPYLGLGGLSNSAFGGLGRFLLLTKCGRDIEA